jgi:Bacterial regulatory proteins, gntR family
MQLFALQSKKEQLAEAIKARIVSGKVTAGTKLSSVRDLAGKFKVSTKIVISALDLLEDERLIKREPGRGVFVRSYSANTNIEVCLLAWNVNLDSDPYFNDLARMSYPPYLQEGFNFTVRTVPFSRNATTSHFAQELQKFDKMCHADCLVINAPNLNAAKIKTCLKIKTPVIFVGDFSHGLDPDIPFNQITGDNTALGENHVRKLAKQEKITEFVLYSPSLEHYFCQKFHEGVSNAAKALNVKMHLIETPKGFSSLDIQKQNKIFLQKTQEIGVSNLCDIPAINGGTPNNFLKEQIKLNAACRNIFYHENSENYVNKFYNTIFKEIKRIAKNPNKTKKIILKEDLDNFVLKQL